MADPPKPEGKTIGTGSYSINMNELDQVYNKYKQGPQVPLGWGAGAQQNMGFERSHSFQIFKEEESVHMDNPIENAYRMAGQYIPIEAPPEIATFLDNSLKMSQLRITANDVMALSIGVLMVTFVIGFAIIAVPFMCKDTGIGTKCYSLGDQSGLAGITAIMAPIVFAIGIILYPMFRTTVAKVHIAGTAPLAVLYIVIYLRSSPSLESAVAFSAKNVTGPLGDELKHLQWGVATREFPDTQQALVQFSEKVQDWAPGISDAFYLIAGSTQQPTPEKRVEMLDKAVNGALTSTRHTMQQFGRSLQMPAIVVNALGILLPVMGLVMAPIVTIMLSDGGGVDITLAVLYNVILPAIILMIIYVLGSRRPGSFSSVDVSQHPDAPKPGCYRLSMGSSTYDIPLLPISLLVFVLGAAYSGAFLINEYVLGAGADATALQDATRAFQTMPIIVCSGLAIGIYGIGMSSQRMSIRNHIKDTEKEFSSALYQLGNIMNQGQPFEIAVTRAAEIMSTSVMRPFLVAIARNIQQLGMPLHSAVYDPEYGALRYCPSDLVANVLEIVLDSTKRGVRIAATTTMNIATYLDNIEEVATEIEGLLSESMSSMKFQAYLLAPVVCGIIVGLSQMITGILAGVGQKVDEGGLGGQMSGGGMGGAFSAENAVPPDRLQLIVGIYIVQLLSILGYFCALLESGPNDTVAMYQSIGQTVLIGTIVYSAVCIVTTLVFAGMATFV